MVSDVDGDGGGGGLTFSSWKSKCYQRTPPKMVEHP